jgi:DNA-binding CsgD family transcriptional regulator
LACSIGNLREWLPKGYIRGAAPWAELKAVPTALHGLVSRSASSHTAWHVLADESRPFAVLCLERRLTAGAFSDEELRGAERLTPLVGACLRAELNAYDSCIELSALRALQATYASSVVFSADLGQIVWTSWPRLVPSGVCVERLQALLRAHLPALSEPALDRNPALRAGGVVRAAPVQLRCVPGSRWLAVGLRDEESITRSAEPAALSNREQQVVQLLCEGHESINVAALTGLSEHTVRTYTRRAYRKLQVKNRADLVRRMLSGVT